MGLREEMRAGQRPAPTFDPPRGIACEKNGRAGEIRTHDLLHPMQARYQATLQPEQMKGQEAARLRSKQVFFPATDFRGNGVRSARKTSNGMRVLNR